MLLPPRRISQDPGSILMENLGDIWMQNLHEPQVYREEEPPGARQHLINETMRDSAHSSRTLGLNVMTSEAKSLKAP